MLNPSCFYLGYWLCHPSGERWHCTCADGFANVRFSHTFGVGIDAFGRTSENMLTRTLPARYSVSKEHGRVVVAFKGSSRGSPSAASCADNLYEELSADMPNCNTLG